MSAAELLAASGRFPMSPGLTDAELDALEDEFAFHFAPDHRDFLAAGLPFGRGWPDWRDADRGALRERLAAPVEGLLFDVGQNLFWYAGWGPQPQNPDDAVAVARRYLMTVPRMVPLFKQRYLPAGVEGHPVLSIFESEVAPYGSDLGGWLHREFGLGEPSAADRRPTVPFWRDLAAG